MTATNPSAPPPITEDDIADFLRRTPGFFERHAEVLASVQICSPHGARAVSLQERQAALLREKIKGLEQRIIEMVRHGSDNAAIAHKLHQWGCALQQIKDPLELPQAVLDGLRSCFDLPQAALRLWGLAQRDARGDGAEGAGNEASEEARALAASLNMPFCGPNRGFEPALWLAQDAAEDPGAPAQSLALLPLREGAIDGAAPTFGLLVLGSPDPQRFEAAMGTEFLARMAEIASAALLRLPARAA